MRIKPSNKNGLPTYVFFFLSGGLPQVVVLDIRAIGIWGYRGYSAARTFLRNTYIVVIFSTKMARQMKLMKGMELIMAI